MSEEVKIDPEIFQWVGMIVQLWTRVEDRHSDLFRIMMGTRGAVHYVVTQNVSNSTLVDWLRVLTSIPRVVQDQHQARLLEVLTLSDQLRAERNSLVHGLLYIDNGATCLQTLNWARQSALQTTAAITVGDLKHFGDEIMALDQELLAIFHLLDR